MRTCGRCQTGRPTRHPDASYCLPCHYDYQRERRGFSNRHTSEIVENLLDLANDFREVGRTGAWRVLVDATNVIKLYREKRREPWIESNKRRVISARKARVEDGITVLYGPRFAIMCESNETGRRAVTSSNADPDHHFLEGESNG